MAPPRGLPPSSSTSAAGDAEAGGRTGYDISYPQCDKAYPPRPYAFGIVGVTRGRAFRHNPCLADQWWGRIAGDFAPALPVWIAGAPNLEAARGWCHRSIGGPVVLVQTLPVQFDENLSCPGHGPMRRFFAT